MHRPENSVVDWFPTQYNEHLSPVINDGLAAHGWIGAAEEAYVHPGIVPPSDYGPQLTPFDAAAGALAGSLNRG